MGNTILIDFLGNVSVNVAWSGQIDAGRTYPPIPSTDVRARLQERQCKYSVILNLTS